MILDPEALEAAAKAVGSTDIATVCITTYLDALAEKIGDTIEFREIGPWTPEKPDSEQQQLPGVDWSDL